ncbi:unnamed protein product [Miscanthus lutarioriparius]|uniref:Protein DETOXIFICATION n=1 Tax=Miscanthus lutarioriparius TaxID=422564 RepID=A0A811R7H5_9POAL|nr:unnamed protein product [Miscanthus lutarioriparius]
MSYTERLLYTSSPCHPGISPYTPTPKDPPPTPAADMVVAVCEDEAGAFVATNAWDAPTVVARTGVAHTSSPHARRSPRHPGGIAPATTGPAPKDPPPDMVVAVRDDDDEANKLVSATTGSTRDTPTIFAGHIGNRELSAVAIGLSVISNFSFGFLLGMGSALETLCGVRVSNELGSGRPRASMYAVMVVLEQSLAFGMLAMVLVLATREQFPAIFTGDRHLQKAVSSITYLLAVTMLLNSVQPVISGVAVGGGWQAVVAYINRCRPDGYREAESPLWWSETSTWMALERLLTAETRPAKPWRRNSSRSRRSSSSRPPVPPGDKVQSFSVSFAFGIHPNYRPSQGLAFFIAKSMNFSSAIDLQYFGIFNTENQGNLSNHIFAIEIDTLLNSELRDIDANHIGIDINNVISNESHTAGFYDDNNGLFNPLNLTSAMPTTNHGQESGSHRHPHAASYVRSPAADPRCVATPRAREDEEEAVAGEHPAARYRAHQHRSGQGAAGSTFHSAGSAPSAVDWVAAAAIADAALRATCHGRGGSSGEEARRCPRAAASSRAVHGPPVAPRHAAPCGAPPSRAAAPRPNPCGGMPDLVTTGRRGGKEGRKKNPSATILTAARPPAARSGGGEVARGGREERLAVVALPLVSPRRDDAVAGFNLGNI